MLSVFGRRLKSQGRGRSFLEGHAAPAAGALVQERSSALTSFSEKDLVVIRLAQVLASESHEAEVRPYIIAAVLNDYGYPEVIHKLLPNRRQLGAQRWATSHAHEVSVRDIRDARQGLERWLSGELRYVGSGFQPLVQDRLRSRGVAGYRKSAQEVRDDWGCDMIKVGTWEFCQRRNR